MPRPNRGAVQTAYRLLPECLDYLDAYADRHGIPAKPDGGPNRNGALNHLLTALTAEDNGDTVTLPKREFDALRAKVERAEQLESVFAETSRAITATKRRVKVAS